MKRLILLIVLLLSPHALGQATFVQVKESQETSPADSTVAVTFDSNITAGNTVICALGFRDTGTVTFSSIANTQSDTWTIAGSAQATPNSADGELRVYYVLSANGGADTVTATFSGTPDTSDAIMCSEYSGVTTFDKVVQGTVAGSTDLDPGDLTTANDNALLITSAYLNFNRTFTAQAGFTLRGAGTSLPLGYQDDVDVGTAGAKNTGITASSSAQAGIIAAAFNTGCTPAKLVLSSTYPQLAIEYEDQVFDEIRIEVQDSGSNLCSGATDSVTVAKGDTGAGTLGGTLTVAAVAGIATFSDLTWDTAEAITLDWTSGALTAIDEQATTVNAICTDCVWARDNASVDGLDFGPTDLDVRADVQLDDWTPASDMVVQSQEDSWALYVSTEGYLGLGITADGSTWLTCESTAAPTTPTRLSIRATVDVDNGAAGWTCQFFTKTSESITNNVGWTQLGSDVTTATATSINDSKQVISLGTYTP